jgi:hypothetical protein
LDFLGFIRPNRDFSKGYEKKIKKIDSRLKLCAKRLKRSFSPFSRPLWAQPGIGGCEFVIVEGS